MIRHLSKVRYLLALLAVMAVLTSCDVHQFPEPPANPGPDNPVLPDDPDNPDNPDYPDDPDQYVDLDLTAVYETEMYLWEHYYDPKLAQVQEQYPDANVDGSHPGTTDLFTGKLDLGVKHVTVQFFLKGNSSSYVRMEDFTHPLSEGYDIKLPIRIMPGEYDVVVWSDMLEDEGTSRFYDATNFHSIKINYDTYRANTDFRDSFRGKESISLGDKGGEYVVEMRRPMAKYEFVTTDLSEFLERETLRRGLNTRASMDDYRVRIYYSAYHPSAYSAYDDILRDSSVGISFETEVNITGESEASLGFDYVFINDYEGAAVQATIVVNDLQGNQVAQSNQITVPLRRDHHTLLRGAFLTQQGSGGVGIDPGFNGDHNIIP